MSSLSDAISSLTPAEREQFAEMIAECREREAQIAKNAEEAERAILALEAKHQRVIDSLRDLQDRVTALHMKVVPAKGRVS